MFQTRELPTLQYEQIWQNANLDFTATTFKDLTLSSTGTITVNKPMTDYDFIMIQYTAQRTNDNAARRWTTRTNIFVPVIGTAIYLDVGGIQNSTWPESQTRCRQMTFTNATTLTSTKATASTYANQEFSSQTNHQACIPIRIWGLKQRGQ